MCSRLANPTPKPGRCNMYNRQVRHTMCNKCRNLTCASFSMQLRGRTTGKMGQLQGRYHMLGTGTHA
eukprot:1159295-Pelagomonas_calceolata.AAC.4